MQTMLMISGDCLALGVMIGLGYLLYVARWRIDRMQADLDYWQGRADQESQSAFAWCTAYEDLLAKNAEQKPPPSIVPGTIVSGLLPENELFAEEAYESL
jgi:hypothetical protein